jgi:hypothetical protein
MGDPAYPWYRSVRGEAIEQGNILEGCPVFLPPEDLAETRPAEAVFHWEEFDLIVMSQTCDMVEGREKLSDVLLSDMEAIGADERPSRDRQGARGRPTG